MDADNRVVLNCGGIRHEVYKVHNAKLMNLIYVCALDDYLVLNIKTFLRSERTIFFDLTNLIFYFRPLWRKSLPLGCLGWPRHSPIMILCSMNISLTGKSSTEYHQNIHNFSPQKNSMSICTKNVKWQEGVKMNYLFRRFSRQVLGCRKLSGLRSLPL